MTTAILIIALAVVGIQLANPHSYVSEAVARVGELGSGQDAPLTNLDSVDQLKSQFNRDDGHTRLLLLFSPT